MSKAKIYTATPADLSPPVQSESFCVDLVLASDYRELEAKCVALAAECESKKSALAELESIATDYGVKFQKAQDALKHQALLHKSQMEAAEKFIAELESYSKTAIEFREAARDENRHLKLSLEAVEGRVIELEARQIALPQRLSPEGYHIDEAYMVDDAEGEYLDRDAVIEAISAAGIKVKGE